MVKLNRLTMFLLVLVFAGVISLSIKGASYADGEQNRGLNGGSKSTLKDETAETDSTQSKAGKEKSIFDKKSSKSNDKGDATTSTWAHIELKGAYREGAKLPGIFGDVETTLGDILGRIEAAATDDKISGLIIKFNSPSIRMGTSNEFIKSIEKVKKSGKPVYAVTNFATMSSYMIASHCDKIFMPESGDLFIYGIQMEIGFYKNMFDKLDIKADILQIGDFKGAGEPYTRSEMSPEFRKNMEKTLDGIYGNMLNTIAKGRGMKIKEVSKLIDQGPFISTKAKEVGLIDEIMYEDEVSKYILRTHKLKTLKVQNKYGKKKINTDFEGFTGFINLMNALTGDVKSSGSSLGPKIAVIYAIGPIMTGKSANDPFAGEVMGSDTIVAAINKASKSSSVKAIVLRVNSPGGSALASDLIWNALEKCDKPVVVSMGDVAASGGYYISMGAEHIFVEPGTITGSIGVVSGKIALDGLYKKVGITTSILSRGKNAGIMSGTTPFSESERKVMKDTMLQVYDLFTSKAAKGRKMDLEKLKSLAGGRVYSGQQAVDNGLVDKIGTLDDAINHAKKLAGLDAEEKVDLMLLPKPDNPFQAMFESMGIHAPVTQSKNGRAHIVKQLTAVLPEKLQMVTKSLWVIDLFEKERRAFVLPYHLKIK